MAPHQDSAVALRRWWLRDDGGALEAWRSSGSAVNACATSPPRAAGPVGRARLRAVAEEHDVAVAAPA